MSDTYFIPKNKCVYCKKENRFNNEEVILGLPFKSEFGVNFVCQWCKKKNIIVQQFKAIKGSK